MATAAKIKKVTSNLHRGGDYTPKPGTGGPIPGPGVPSTPKPKAAINSGKPVRLR